MLFLVEVTNFAVCIFRPFSKCLALDGCHPSGSRSTDPCLKPLLFSSFPQVNFRSGCCVEYNFGCQRKFTRHCLQYTCSTDGYHTQNCHHSIPVGSISVRSNCTCSRRSGVGYRGNYLHLYIVVQVSSRIDKIECPLANSVINLRSYFRYKAYKERMSRMYITPRYDPVFVEPNLKEYETQVICPHQKFSEICEICPKFLISTTHSETSQFQLHKIQIFGFRF